MLEDDIDESVDPDVLKMQKAKKKNANLCIYFRCDDDTYGDSYVYHAYFWVYSDCLRY